MTRFATVGYVRHKSFKGGMSTFSVVPFSYLTDMPDAVLLVEEVGIKEIAKARVAVFDFPVRFQVAGNPFSSEDTNTVYRIFITSEEVEMILKQPVAEEAVISCDGVLPMLRLTREEA